MKQTRNWKKGQKTPKGIVVGLFLLCFVAVLSLPNIIYGDTTQINSAADLVKLAEESKQTILKGNYELTADIDLSDSAFCGIGSEDHPFSGTFNGNGHTISGLSNQANHTNSLQSGLFVYTKDATIKNLKIDSANLTLETGGGIVAAKAETSVFHDIKVKNSTLDIAFTKAVAEAPVKAGFAGAIAGYASGCGFYDCEAENCTVGSTQKKITANIGEGFYVGGLIGVAEKETVVEYSRVIDGNVKADISTDTAVLDRTNIHNGGLVGTLREKSWVIDCFSSADLNTTVEMSMQTAVGVTNYFGGIAATMEGEACGISRSHYSGKQIGVKKNTARGTVVDLYASGICGSVGDDNAKNITYVYYDYDKLLPDGDKEIVITALRRENGDNRGENEKVKRIETEVYGQEKSYVTYDFIGSEEVDYANVEKLDDTASTTRDKIKEALSTEGASHINKWIINSIDNMPVHGHSFAARLDFPGAGSVTIAETYNNNSTKDILNKAQTTVSVNESVRQYKDDEDTSTVQLTAKVNEGYYFAGWYRTEKGVSNIPYTDLAGWKAMVSQTEENKLPEGTTYHAGDTYGDTNTYDAPAIDDDFYLGHFQAEIKFMYLGTNASADPALTVRYDYMDKMGDNAAYRDAITKVQTYAVQSNVVSKENGVFAGWTTNPNGIANAGLEDLATLGSKFYGQNTVVTEPLVLYPVFIQDASKIVFTTIEAGTTDKDGYANKVSFYNNHYGYNTRTLKQYSATETYTASVDFVNQEDGSYKCILSLKDSNGNIVEGDSMWESSGYRFLGWYQIETTGTGEVVKVDGKPNAARISRDLITELPTETALSGIRVYEARFEYEVQYWESYYKVTDYSGGVNTRKEWYEYGEEFKDFDGHLRPDGKGTPKGWFFGINTDQDGDGDLDRADQKKMQQDHYTEWHRENLTWGEVGKTDHDPYNAKGLRLDQEGQLATITEPIYAFYAFDTQKGTYDAIVMTKFPNASKNLKMDIYLPNILVDTRNTTCTVDVLEGYTFWGWTRQIGQFVNSDEADAGDDGDDGKFVYYESPSDRDAWGTSHYEWKNYQSADYDYIYVAHLYANIDFLKKDYQTDSMKKVTVNRRYLDSLFREKSEDVYYTFWDGDTDLSNDKKPANRYTRRGLFGINEEESSRDGQTALTLQPSPSNEDMYVKGYKFLGWIDAAEIGYDPEKTYAEQSYMYRYVYDNPDDPFVTSSASKAKGLIRESDNPAHNIQITETMTLIPVYTYDFSVSVTSNLSDKVSSLDHRILRNDANTGFDIYLTKSADINTTDYPFMGWYDKDGKRVSEKLNDDVVDFTILDTDVQAAIKANGKNPSYVFTANFNIRTTYHDSAANYEDLVESQVPNKVLGTNISKRKPVETPEDCYFIGWTDVKPTEANKGEYSKGDYHVISDLKEQYSIEQYAATGSGKGLADFLLTGEEIVLKPMDIYPVYIHLDAIKDNIIVTSNMGSEDTSTKLGLDASGLYLETNYGKDGYMFVEWKHSEDNKEWSFFTTLDEGMTKYYISMPALDKVLDTANDNKVIQYYRADYGVTITYCGITNDVIYKHGLIVGENLATIENGTFNYYKKVPMDMLTYYVTGVGERYGALTYMNRMYTNKENKAGTSFVTYANKEINESLTFYLDIYMMYAMDNTESLCPVDNFKIGFSENKMNVYWMDDYTKEQYSTLLVGVTEMNNGEPKPIGLDRIPVNLYLHDDTMAEGEHKLYQTVNTAEHEEVTISTTIELEGEMVPVEVPFTNGIAEFNLSGSLQLTMSAVTGYIGADNETFFLTLTPPDGSDAKAMKIAIKSGETVTVKNLPFGEWTVKQDTPWAWRYTPGKIIKTVEIDSVFETYHLEFANSRNQKLYFTDEEKDLQ